MLTTTEAFDKSALAGLIANAAILGGDLLVTLFLNDVIPSKTLVRADLVEPSWFGYLNQNMNMGPIYRDSEGKICSQGRLVTWRQPGAITPTILRGIAYLFGPHPDLLGVELFAVPVSLNDSLDAFFTMLKYVQSSDSAGFTTVVF
jgi:hypothetical protein